MLLLEIIGGLLGAMWGLYVDQKSLQIRPGTPLGIVCSFLAAEDGLETVLGSSLACFLCSRKPFGVCAGMRETRVCAGGVCRLPGLRVVSYPGCLSSLCVHSKQPYCIIFLSLGSQSLSLHLRYPPLYSFIY